MSEELKECLKLNLVFTVISILLFLLIPFSYLFSPLTLIFRPFWEGVSCYGYFSAAYILLEGLVWRALKLKRSLRAPKKKGIKSVIMYYEEIAKDFLAFVGFKGRFSLVKVMIGMVAGILTGLVTLLCRAHFENSSIHFTEPVILLVLFFTRLEIWGVILIVPIIEEIVFRGVFINRFMII